MSSQEITAMEFPPQIRAVSYSNYGLKVLKMEDMQRQKFFRIKLGNNNSLIVNEAGLNIIKTRGLKIIIEDDKNVKDEPVHKQIKQNRNWRRYSFEEQNQDRMFHQIGTFEQRRST